jgi:ethanolamine utilization protein EutN
MTAVGRRRAQRARAVRPKEPDVFLGKVTGNVVATQKVLTVQGKKLLTIEAYKVTSDDPPQLKATGRTAIAVDTLGAGEGEFVLVTQGSSARLTEATKNLPVDAVVIGIVDVVQVRGQHLYRSGQ